MMDKKFDGETLELIYKTLECIGDGIIMIDAYQKITYINKATEDLIGWKSNDIYQVKLSQVFCVLDENKEAYIASLLEEVMSTGKSRGLKKYSFILTRKGEQRYISANLSPILDKSGRYNGVVIVFRDITRIVNMEKQQISECNNFKAVFDASPTGMVIVNRLNRISQANPSFLQMFDLTDEEVKGKLFGDAISCVSSLVGECGISSRCISCIVHKTTQEVIHNQQPSKNRVSNFSILKNGEVISPWFKFDFVPIMIDGENQLLMVIEDITTQKSKEETILRTQETYMKMLDFFPAIIWRTDQEGRFDYLNKTGVEYLGLEFQHLVKDGWGKIFDLNNERDQDIYPKAMAAKKSFYFEHFVRRKDGVRRYCINYGTPFYNLDNQFEGFIGMILDVTDRRESQLKYQSLFYNLNDAFIYNKIIYNEDNKPIDFRCIEMNTASEQMFKITAKEAYGKSILEYYEEIGKVLLNEVKGLSENGQNKRIDKYYCELQKKWYCISVFEPNEGYMALIISDISEREESAIQLKNAKIAAEEANRAKSEFLANMSHEIRTPLNGILGMIDLTLLTNLSDEQRDNLITAKSCSSSLLKIINDILDFSKMEAGKLEIDTINFDIKQLIEDLMKLHTPRAIRKGIELNYSFSSSIPQYLVGDPNRIRQVLNNLINNAIKFTNEGHITVSLRLQSNSEDKLYLDFSVADTGIGIKEKDIEKLFKSFSQIDGSYTKKYNGTGLGLVISKQLIEMMGGSIGVKSVEGRGSSFYFTLPFSIGKKEETKSLPNHTVKQTVGRYILLAEDDLINQQVVSKMLLEKGHRVDIANNGIEVVDLYLRNKQYDLILMDIQMPKMDGIEATNIIRKNEGDGEHIPIVALTAYALQGDKERFIAMGMNYYLSKPVDMNELYSIINLVTGSKEERYIDMAYRINPEGDIVFIKESKGLITPNKGDEIKNKIGSLKKAIDEKDMHQIQIQAKRIKEMAKDAGLDGIRTIAFKIELAIRRENLLEVIELVKSLEIEIENYNNY